MIFGLFWTEINANLQQWTRSVPKGPQGQKRKADVIGNAVLVMKIAAGKIEPGDNLDRRRLLEDELQITVRPCTGSYPFCFSSA